MRQYPDDWDLERIANDQAGECVLAIGVIFVVAAILFAVIS